MFKVGQKVKCVKSHSQGVLNVGAEYIVQDVMECECKIIKLDVGVKSATYNEYMHCMGCGIPYYAGRQWFMSSRLFSPLQEDSAFAEESLREVRMQQLEHRLEELEKLVNHPEKSI